jgi:hypothetical protein
VIADLIRAFVEAVAVRQLVGAWPLPPDWTGRFRETYGGDLVLEWSEP